MANQITVGNMYKIGSIIEAQLKDELGIDISIDKAGDGLPETVAIVKLRGNLKNVEDFDKLGAGFEKLIRKHIKNKNLTK